MTTKITRWTLGFLLMTGAAVACGQGGATAEAGKSTSDRSKAEAELRATDLAWSAAASRKDVDATVAFMANDGETLAPNEPAAKDKAAVRTGWVNLLGLPGLAIDWRPLRVQVAASGELGFTSGIYTLTSNDANGKPVTDRGKYLEVWTKVDGQWRCLSDAYSSDIPLP